MNNKDLAKEEQIKTAEVSDDSTIANKETGAPCFSAAYTSPIYYPKKHTVESYRSQQKKRRKL